MVGSYEPLLATLSCPPYPHGTSLLSLLPRALFPICIPSVSHSRPHLHSCASELQETDIQENDKNKAKKDKTKHENEKSVKKQSKSKSQ
ncbi:hypothetical protein Tco_0672492 [Tanacetum coccineum]